MTLSVKIGVYVVCRSVQRMMTGVGETMSVKEGSGGGGLRDAWRNRRPEERCGILESVETEESEDFEGEELTGQTGRLKDNMDDAG